MNQPHQCRAFAAGALLRQLSVLTGSMTLGLMACLAWVTPVHAQANVTLAWNPITNPLVAGFNVYYGGASGVYTNKIDVGQNTSLTLSNLTAGGTYYFASTTYSAAGAESALSAEVAYTVPVPSPAVQLSAAPLNQFLLTMTGVTGHAYDIQASQDLITWTVIGTATPDASGSATFTDTNAASYPSRFYRTVENSP